MDRVREIDRKTDIQVGRQARKKTERRDRLKIQFVGGYKMNQVSWNNSSLTKYITGHIQNPVKHHRWSLLQN